MRLKFPKNSFLVVGEREKGNSEFTSFVVVSVVEFLKIHVCVTLVLDLTLSANELNFGRFTFSVACLSSLFRFFFEDNIRGVLYSMLERNDAQAVITSKWHEM